MRLIAIKHTFKNNFSNIAQPHDGRESRRRRKAAASSNPQRRRTRGRCSAATSGGGHLLQRRRKTLGSQRGGRSSLPWLAGRVSAHGPREASRPAGAGRRPSKRCIRPGQHPAGCAHAAHKEHVACRSRGGQRTAQQATRSKVSMLLFIYLLFCFSHAFNSCSRNWVVLISSCS